MSFVNGMSMHVTVTIRPEDAMHFFALFKPVFDQAIAEPECIFFEVYAGAPAGRISWVEDWTRDPQWYLDHQLTKDYYREFLALTEPLYVAPREIEVFERLSADYCYSTQEMDWVSMWTHSYE
ncbi:hypothetical protein F4802DRAFT_584019 [Xylaria palmicola]|nr:hypothetical protein F4802DRAFT_584019 [Xylaria palmicola]